MKRPEKQDSAREPAAPRASERTAIELADLGVLRVRGTDAVQFLQGQLSNDVTRLAAEGSLLAGYHNPQGRVIAIMRLVQAAEGDVLALLPRELVPAVLSRLARFVLRAKVRLSDDSPSWRIEGVVQPDAPAALAIKIAAAPVRWIVLRASEPSGAASAGAEAERRAWTLLDIASGLPQVYARTSEAFVAQMLNLDLIDGVAFSKGCYTGQEVIARAHYRGRVKRRMQRWRTLASASLAPGENGELADGRRFRVVEAALLPDGRCEFLAVTTPDPQSPRGSVEPESAERGSTGQTAPTGTAEPADSDGEPESAARGPLAAESLPLPYALPG